MMGLSIVGGRGVNTLSQDESIGDAEYIQVLEGNNALLRQSLELETALKANYKDLFEREAAMLAKLRATLEIRADLKDKIGCFVPKDAPDYTENQLQLLQWWIA